MSASSEDALRLEQQLIETSLHELRAGEGYIPGLDEVPLTKSNECLAVDKDDESTLPKITVSGGSVTSSASIVYTRESLSRELGLNVSGNIPLYGGLTGAASLAYKTTFDNQSAAVVFQTAGTYESVLTAANIPAFDVTRVANCGFGYVARAQHRVAAALAVSVRSTASGSDLTSELSLGKADFAEAKATLNNIVRRGHIEISVRFASDVIPDLPSSPFSDAVIVVGDSDEDKADALDKISTALGWLAEAQAALNTYFVSLQTSPDDTPVAPAQRIQFRYYPSTPPEIRSAIERAAKNTVDTRNVLATTIDLSDRWSAFDDAIYAGKAHEWNIAKNPRATVDALIAEKSSLIDDGGKLSVHEDTTSARYEDCSLALRNDMRLATVAELSAALTSACVAPDPVPVDYDSELIRHLAVVSETETMTGFHTCPTGFRLPRAEEAPLFEPWSHAVRTKAEQGLWLETTSCAFGRSWLIDGKADCSPFMGATKGISLCVSRTGGPLPK